MTDSNIAWSVWAALTFVALTWSCAQFVLPNSPGWSAMVFLASLVSISFGCARATMIFRHRDGRIPGVNRWRRLIVAIYAVAFLAVGVPSFLADSFGMVNGIYLGILLLAGPSLFAALGSSDPNHPGWTRSEALTMVKQQRKQ